MTQCVQFTQIKCFIVLSKLTYESFDSERLNFCIHQQSAVCFNESRCHITVTRDVGLILCQLGHMRYYRMDERHLGMNSQTIQDAHGQGDCGQTAGRTGVGQGLLATQDGVHQSGHRSCEELLVCGVSIAQQRYPEVGAHAKRCIVCWHH